MRVEVKSDFLVALVLIFAMNSVEYSLIFLAAAAVHELGHLLAMKLFKIKEPLLSLGITGAQIFADMRFITYRAEMLIFAAGIVSNILLCGVSLAFLQLVFDMRIIFFFFANMFYALINSLPVSGLDGGKISECVLLSFFDPWTAYKVVNAISLIFCMTAVAVSAFLCLRGKGNLTLVIISVAFFLQCIPSKPFWRKAS